MSRTLALVLLLAAPRTLLSSEVEPAFLTKEVPVGRADSFKITLRTDQPLEKVWIRAVDYSIDRTGRISIEELKDARHSARMWCRLRETEITLRKGKDEVVEIPLFVPGGTPGGEYHLGVQVYSLLKDPAKDPSSNIKVALNLVVLAILQVAGAAPKIAAEIVDSAVRVVDATPEVRSVFQSRGTASVVSRMAAYVRDADRRILDKVRLKASGSLHEDGQAFVLPDGMRDFAGQGNRKLPPGKYTLEVFSVFGPKDLRISKSLEFEVKESDAVATRPIDDIVLPAKSVVEMRSGGVQVAMVEIKNRGYNPIELALTSDFEGLGFVPEKLAIDPGQALKVRIRIRLPAAEDPRRDLEVRLSDGKDARTFTIAIYAPGTAPKEAEKGK